MERPADGSRLHKTGHDTLSETDDGYVLDSEHGGDKVQTAGVNGVTVAVTTGDHRTQHSRWSRCPSADGSVAGDGSDSEKVSVDALPGGTAQGQPGLTALDVVHVADAFHGQVDENGDMNDFDLDVRVTVVDEAGWHAPGSTVLTSEDEPRAWSVHWHTRVPVVGDGHPGNAPVTGNGVGHQALGGVNVEEALVAGWFRGIQLAQAVMRNERDDFQEGNCLKLVLTPHAHGTPHRGEHVAVSVLTTALGRPEAASVKLDAGGDGASVDPRELRSDGSGRAQVTWALGPSLPGGDTLCGTARSHRGRGTDCATLAVAKEWRIAAVHLQGELDATSVPGIPASETAFAVQEHETIAQTVPASRSKVVRVPGGGEEANASFPRTWVQTGAASKLDQQIGCNSTTTQPLGLSAYLLPPHGSRLTIRFLLPLGGLTCMQQGALPFVAIASPFTQVARTYTVANLASASSLTLPVNVTFSGRASSYMPNPDTDADVTASWHGTVTFVPA